MPELPEVETIRRDLERSLSGKIIQKCTVRDRSVLTGIGPSGKPIYSVRQEDFIRQVSNQKIQKFLRRGKYLVVEFSSGAGLVFHLRMTGQLLEEPPQYPERIAFHFTDGNMLYFADRRRFGTVRYSAHWQTLPEILALGPEPLSSEFTSAYLLQKFNRKNAPVHAALLNQSLVAGIGNIYAAEALFLAGIRPQRQAAKVKTLEAEKLCQTVRCVLEESIRHRGYSMRNYVDTLGRKGRSQLFSKVYGKEGLPCPQCQTTLLRQVIGGRSAVYCKICQK